MMGKIRESILTKIMRAPVNLFFDVTPTSTIMGKFNGDMHMIRHITWRAIHLSNQWIDLFSTFYLLYTNDFRFAFVVPVVLYLFYRLQTYAMGSYKEMQNLMDSNFREVGITEGEIFSGTQMIRAMGAQGYALNNNV